jgi:hypothetical protein
LLPRETEKVWDFLKAQPTLAGMVLVGGTALSLHLSHRISEDLDIACLEETLPRRRIQNLIHAGSEAGFDFASKDDEAALQEFVHGGLDLHDYQQDFIVLKKVKLSFFVADQPLQRILSGAPEALLRVASVRELFKSKAIVSARRSKTRDWFDLYVLMTQHSFTLHDYFAAFREAGIDSQAEIGLGRICSGVPQKTDEGFAHLLSNPPSLADMTNYFAQARDSLEQELAAGAYKSRQQP